MLPKDILEEEERLEKKYFSTDEDEDWDEFCSKNASKRYLDWARKEDEIYEENLKKGLIIN